MSTVLPLARPLGPRRARAAFLAALLCGVSCGPASNLPPDADWPTGALLSADRPQLLRMLSEAEQLEGTPLARLARELRQVLPDCDALEARVSGLTGGQDLPSGSAGLRDAIRCVEPSGPLEGLHDYRGNAGIALAIPTGAGPRLLLRGSVRQDGLLLDVIWRDVLRTEGSTGDLLAGLLPGSEAAGAPLLAADDRILHARVRSQRLDLEALVPEGSQGDQLFRLRSGLLSLALLDGTWELALYAPSEGAKMPRAALALGVRLRSAAENAVEQLLAELEAGWSIRRVPLAVGRGKGACLPELKLMPELAPCVLTTDRAVVVGWNAASLRHALGDGRSASTTLQDIEAGLPASATQDAGRVELDLVRLRQADLKLAAMHGADPTAVTRWPWRRVVARGQRQGDSVELSIVLERTSGEAGS